MARATIALLIASVFILLPLVAPRAEAHASLIRSSPDNNEAVRRPPTRVILYFSEPIEQKLTKIEVFDAQQAQVDKEDIAFDNADATLASVGLNPLGPGVYFVRWSNVSRVDGHPYEGQYPFVVRNVDGSLPEGVDLENLGGSQGGGGELLPKNVDSALKWVAMLALATAAGAAFFIVAVWRPAGNFLEEAQYRQAEEAGDGWLAAVGHVLLPLSFVASAALMLVTVQRFTTSTNLLDYLTDVRAGQFRGLSIAGILIALAGADLVFLSRSRALRNAGIAAVILAGFGAIYTYSAVSHAATGAGQFWSIAADFAHFAASAVWLGALAMLPFVLWWSARRLDERPRWLLLANVFDRFSIVAGLSVAVILATGTFSALVEVPEWSAIRQTTYGRVLLAKLTLVGLLLPVAGLNAYVLKPRLVREIDEAYQQEGGVAPADAPARVRSLLQRTIGGEIALVVAVFAAASVLSQTSTAKGELAAEQALGGTRFRQEVQAGDDGRFTLEIAPNRVGINDYSLTVARADGTPLETVTQARLRFNFDGPVSIPQSELILTAFEPGEFRGSGAYFTQGGNWRAELSLRRSDGDDISRTVILGVRPAKDTAPPEGGLFDLPFDSLTWNEVAGVALIILGVLGVLYRKQLEWTPRLVMRIGMTLIVAAMIGGGVLAFGVDTHEAGGNPTEGNPVAPTEDSVAGGRMLFQQNCIVCHGADGRGDGPAAAQLDPAPTDFRQHIPLHTDPQFYAFIARGYPDSAMPAFAEQFSEEEIWNLVNFLRAAFTEVPTE